MGGKVVMSPRSACRTSILVRSNIVRYVKGGLRTGFKSTSGIVSTGKGCILPKNVSIRARVSVSIKVTETMSSFCANAITTTYNKAAAVMSRVKFKPTKYPLRRRLSMCRKLTSSGTIVSCKFRKMIRRMSRSVLGRLRAVVSSKIRDAGICVACNCGVSSSNVLRILGGVGRLRKVATFRYRGRCIMRRLGGRCNSTKGATPVCRTGDEPGLTRTRTMEEILCLTGLTNSTPICVMRLSYGRDLRTIRRTEEGKRGGVFIRAYARCLALARSECGSPSKLGCVVSPPLHARRSLSTL